MSYKHYINQGEETMGGFMGKKVVAIDRTKKELHQTVQLFRKPSSKKIIVPAMLHSVL
jgi:hypothetical protein